MILRQALVELSNDSIFLFLDMLTDEYDFYHAVAQFLIPFLLQLWVIHQDLVEFVFRHGSQPLASLLYSLLLASLFEHVAHVALIIEIADSLGANHVSRPFSSYEIIEETQVERLATIVNEGADSVFLNFSAFMIMVMVVMMVVMMMFMLVMIVVMVIVVMMMMLMFVFLVMMVMTFMWFFFIIFFMLFVSF